MIPLALVFILSSISSGRLYSSNVNCVSGCTAVISHPSDTGGFVITTLKSLYWIIVEPFLEISTNDFGSMFDFSTTSFYIWNF